MKFVLFYHSLRSDWNHGNAHFLRGVVAELLARGHEVQVYEPADAWSVQNLVADHGATPLQDFQQAYPGLQATIYGNDLDLDLALAEADIVIVHEWNSHSLVGRLGQHRRHSRHYRLLFHDTHHRAISAPEEMRAYDLAHYDGVLAYGEVLRQIYLSRGWAQNAWTWHEAADTRVFKPLPEIEKTGDVVWIGNWGDDERTAELEEFLFTPLEHLQLRATIHGVRYPQSALARLSAAGIIYGGWLPNFRAPEVFAQHRVTLHVPRRPYVEALRGIPTIRPFEALACGIPLISAPWDDVEHLFTPGQDFIVAQNGAEVQRHLRQLLHEPEYAADLARHGLATIHARHTCRHRVDELLAVAQSLTTLPISAMHESFNERNGQGKPQFRSLESSPSYTSQMSATPAH